jgi:hypothetical protein
MLSVAERTMYTFALHSLTHQDHPASHARKGLILALHGKSFILLVPLTRHPRHSLTRVVFFSSTRKAKASKAVQGTVRKVGSPGHLSNPSWRCRLCCSVCNGCCAQSLSVVMHVMLLFSRINAAHPPCCSSDDALDLLELCSVSRPVDDHEATGTRRVPPPRPSTSEWMPFSPAFVQNRLDIRRMQSEMHATIARV